MYSIVKLAIENPVTSISLLILLVQMFVKSAVNFKTRDWYGLYLSFSYTGVELSLLTFVTFLGLVVSEGGAVLARCYGDIKDEQTMFWHFIFTLFIFAAPLAISIWLFVEAGNLGRDRFSVLLKAPTIKKMFVPHAAQLMLSAVAKERYYQTGDGMLKGLLLTFFSISIGIFVTAFFIKFMIGG